MKPISIALAVLLKMSVASAAMSDGEIAGVIQAVNNAEVKISSLATINTTSPDVKQFGALVVDDSKANNTRLLTLFTSKKGGTILSSTKSTDVEYKAGIAAKNLEGLKDKTFDNAYLDQQLIMDKGVLEDIDSYIPQAVRADFKQFLMDTRVLVQKHWDRANALRYPSSQMSEGQIAGIIKAVDLAEVGISSLVPRNSTNSKVVEFGNKVAADHRANLIGLAALFQPSDILETEKSLAIKSNGDLAVSNLGGLKDINFDIAYLDHQIQMDEGVLAEIDADYPMIIRADFKTFVMQTRAAVLKHWEDAKVLRAVLTR